MVNVYCFIIDRTIKMFFIILYIFFYVCVLKLFLLGLQLNLMENLKRLYLV